MNSKNIEILLKRKDQLENRIKLLRVKTQSQDRKDETRRKILAGAYILEKYNSNNNMNILIQELDNFLFRARDRSLFGLAPRIPKDKAISEIIKCN